MKQNTQNLQTCRVFLVGKEMAEAVATQAARLGFGSISIIRIGEMTPADLQSTDLVVCPLGPGGTVMVVAPDGPRLPSLFRADSQFPRALLRHAAHHCAFFGKQCPWLFELFEKENIAPTPKGIRKTAALCADILSAIADGTDLKSFPRFYVTE